MRSAALPLAWQLWRRHRIGLSLLAASWVALPLLVGVLIAAGAHPSTALKWTLMPLLFTLSYVVAVFSFALDADLAFPASSFPARLFTLPVPTRSLVVWPMFFGTVAMTCFWTAWNLAFLWSGAGQTTPVSWWPGFLLAAILAWVQATLWLPVPAAWVRLAALFTSVGTIGAAAIIAAYQQDVPEWAIAVGLTFALLAAYGTAFVGVRRARHGEIPDWRWWSRLSDVVTRIRRGRRRTMPSPGDALVWMVERRLGGWILPLLTAWCLVPALFLPWIEDALALLAAAPDHPGFAAAVRAVSIPGVLLLNLLIVPPGLATLLGNDLGRLTLSGNGYAISPFLATRPVRTATLVFAKLRLVVRCILASWAILLPVALGWFVLGGKYAQAADSDFVRCWGPTGACGLLALTIAGLVGLTWTQAVKALWAGLTGRPWVAAANLIWSLTLGVAAIAVLAGLKEHPESRATFFALASWLAGAGVVLKVAAAGWVLRVVGRRRLMPSAFLAALVAGWIAAAAGLAALLCILISGDWVPPHLLALGAMLFVPLTRVAAAPLAVEWNRHR
jgi:hypothetical protein